MYVNLINFTTFVQKTTSCFDSAIEFEKNNTKLMDEFIKRFYH